MVVPSAAIRHYEAVVKGNDLARCVAKFHALAQSKVADRTLISTLRDVSRIPLTEKAVDRLLAAGIQPMGAVLAGVSTAYFQRSYAAYCPEADIDQQLDVAKYGVAG